MPWAGAFRTVLKLRESVRAPQPRTHPAAVDELELAAGDRLLREGTHRVAGVRVEPLEEGLLDYDELSVGIPRELLHHRGQDNVHVGALDIVASAVKVSSWRERGKQTRTVCESNSSFVTSVRALACIYR